MQENPLGSSPSFIGWRLLGLFFCTLLGAGCAGPPRGQVMLPESPATSSTVSEINTALASAVLQTPTSSADYRLGPEDLLEITIYNIPEGGNTMPQGTTGPIARRMEVRLSQEGTIALPMLGDIPAAGLTAATLERLLRQRYEEFLHAPQLGVQIKEYRSQQVSVIGAVSKPGMYQLPGPRTLVDVLSMAGGINERAGEQVHIYRQGPQGRQTHIVDLLALASHPQMVNMPVNAGDVVNVPLAGMFFVEGAVGKPGSYPLTRPYTLTQALAIAGGVTRTLASYDEVAIYRRSNGTEAEKIPIDLSAIWDRRASDPPIATNDVISVPISTGKYIVERFLGRIGLGGVPGVGF
jgi:polysaccharide export outer membrane protein